MGGLGKALRKEISIVNYIFFKRAAKMTDIFIYKVWMYGPGVFFCVFLVLCKKICGNYIFPGSLKELVNWALHFLNNVIISSIVVSLKMFLTSFFYLFFFFSFFSSFQSMFLINHLVHSDFKLISMWFNRVISPYLCLYLSDSYFMYCIL